MHWNVKLSLLCEGIGGKLREVPFSPSINDIVAKPMFRSHYTIQKNEISM